MLLLSEFKRATAISIKKLQRTIIEKVIKKITHESNEAKRLRALTFHITKL